MSITVVTLHPKTCKQHQGDFLATDKLFGPAYRGTTRVQSASETELRLSIENAERIYYEPHATLW
ncbi:unnamed protein product [Chondrus crispus]|uniref:Uncharacterized protein n=1 Tax=Chondrus crispus TaxID=2769 RepID=R7QEC3_CHOCR|nr:unnamed protein product [Chondrus crispus]CDF36108.1 unnamed protein product [Chondrus crispus]|eukprot:XP_005715927.1 unnamed protein product [Chondrus crispus]